MNNKVIIGFFGIIAGAIIAGGIQIIRDILKLKNEKLATAYAFKGEIQSLLEIIEIRKLKEYLNQTIENKKTFIGFYNEQYNNTKNIIKSLNNTALQYDVSYLYPFYFTVSQDLFLVKYTFKDRMGLLNNSLENIIKFYQYVNILLLDMEFNKIKKEELDEIRAKARSVSNSHEVIMNYYYTHNIIGYVENDIEYHKTIFEALNRIIVYGQNCINDLDKFINAEKRCQI
jgi:hypothetical protein